jgi:hypothetical protein
VKVRVALTIYKDLHGYFRLYRFTAGAETYGAGRYLEPEPIGKKVRWTSPGFLYCNNDHTLRTPLRERLKVPIRWKIAHGLGSFY